MDLIVGATGYLGIEIGRFLTLRGRSVRGLYRKNSSVGMVRKLKENSIELVYRGQVIRAAEPVGSGLAPR
jgi:nucleoside-diphosphate-sugar epimerase